ncbi:hypothetical protein CPB83DRAFT_265454 [Crepidotus variabilis]|uniref:Uncharacterized protein n=1 Tax=Crepidotus variabilis TaxID=179855 RepID=A0A9P6JQA7_9AGAR|nr:hypothetical protein CPB83DRAFT_265454 [Crepidotus variabilis]
MMPRCRSRTALPKIAHGWKNPEVLKRYGVDVPSLVEDLGKAIEDVFKDMKDNFTLRSIEKESAFLQHLDVQLSDILDKIEGAFIKTFVAFRMKKDLVRQEPKLVRSPMRVFVLVSGKIMHRHPALMAFVLTNAFAILLEAALPPILVGLISRIGFGALGLQKSTTARSNQIKFYLKRKKIDLHRSLGTLAAKVQRIFYQAEVPKKALFGTFKRMGMKAKL